jgi:molybdate transport system ATP-binding protein
VVLDDVSFALRAGERWALVGPNGAGKTFLLKMLRGDVWPTPTGRERRVYRLDGTGIAKERIAYVGPERQDKYVRYGWNLTVEQIVTTGLFDEDIPLTTPTRAQRNRVERTLRRFGLSGLRHRRLLTLSYGQRRVALVARAFASPARVLLLDEVFNGLDAKVRRTLKTALEAPRSGHEWVLSSHRLHELPRNVTHLAQISGGRLTMSAGAEFPAARALGARGSGRKRLARVRVDARNLLRTVAARTSSGPEAEPRAPSPARARTTSANALVRIRNATVYRDYRAVLRRLDWALARGEHWAVTGANGSGKSTLLNLIYGDLHPALGGTIERAGAPTGTRIEFWKQRVGWVSPELQADHFLAKSLEEIVVSGRYSSVGLNAPMTRADRRAALPWLEFFGIAPLRDRGPRQVSYGQMRLALIARAMVNDPELLLLDEPVTGLDGDVRAFVLATLERLARAGTQIVMAVHDSTDVIPSITHVLHIGRAGRTSVAVRPTSQRANRKTGGQPVKAVLPAF